MSDDLVTMRDDLVGLAKYAFGRLRTRLAGLPDEEYLWEPVAGCWSVRPAADGTFRADRVRPEPVPPPFTTIAWRVAHVIDVLAGERNATWLGVPAVGALDRAGDPGTAGDALRQLDDAFALFRAHVAAVDAATLTDPVGPVGGRYADSTRAAFVLHELDELIHHGAEIAALRDLYRAADGRRLAAG